MEIIAVLELVGGNSQLLAVVVGVAIRWPCREL